MYENTVMIFAMRVACKNDTGITFHTAKTANEYTDLVGFTVICIYLAVFMFENYLSSYFGCKVCNIYELQPYLAMMNNVWITIIAASQRNCWHLIYPRELKRNGQVRPWWNLLNTIFIMYYKHLNFYGTSVSKYMW